MRSKVLECNWNQEPTIQVILSRQCDVEYTHAVDIETAVYLVNNIQIISAEMIA